MTNDETRSAIEAEANKRNTEYDWSVRAFEEGAQWGIAYERKASEAKIKLLESALITRNYANDEMRQCIDVWRSEYHDMQAERDTALAKVRILENECDFLRAKLK